MAQAKFCMELDWKSFNVDMNSVEAWMKANAGDQYAGNCAGAKLQLWFLEEPAQDVKDAINAHWDALDESSDEAKNYKDEATRKAEAEAATAAAKASAKSKLAALGLSESEIAAIIGA
jgi:hypothetical protein